MKPPRSLSEFVRRLRAVGELVEVSVPVRTDLEIAEIHRRIVRSGGPALLFSNVEGSRFPLVTNLFGSKARIDLAFGPDVEERVHAVIQLCTEGGFPPSFSTVWRHRRTLLSLLRRGTRKRRSGAILDHVIDRPDLTTIPFIRCWPDDGGQFLTLPVVATTSPAGRGTNLGVYRIQRFDERTTGLHWQISKGGAIHYREAEERGTSLPIVIYLGGPPAIVASAIAPLPENCSELLLASFLLDSKVDLCGPESLIADCDIALVGHANPLERRLEGPFGDHYGYQDPSLAFPVFHCSKIWHRRDAMVPATVVGKPLQEDAWIGQFVQKLLRPWISILVPSVVELHTYPETGFHPLAAVRVRERHEKEALSTALRLLGEGQLALTKLLIVTDGPVPIDRIELLLPYLLERMRPEEDLIILPNTSHDTLDMTGPTTNRGSKALFFGLGPRRRSLPTHLPATSSLPPKVAHALPVVPGCLVIDGPTHAEMPDPLLLASAFAEWPLIVLVDDAIAATASTAEFLWHACTRFEPARDIYSKGTTVRRNGVSFSFPLLIDARIKPGYQAPLVPDPETVDCVDRRWHEYFAAK